MKKYEVKGNILGFENTMNVEITEIDELFSTMKDCDNKDISFTLVNPYKLREYSFDLPRDIKVLQSINEKSNASVYNIMIVQNPLENSTVNFLAPIIVNDDNNTIGQAVLKSGINHNFGVAENIKTYTS
jgi:flagellar assembly factor FliW